MQEKIFDMLLDKDELSWKTIIYDLVRSEEMDPWDVDVTLLTQRYIEIIKDIKEHDFKIPGKILLAAAMLLKMKATHLLDKDVARLDALINSSDEEDFDEEFDELEEFTRSKRDKRQYTLIPRNPQPRKRKVSVHDLVKALQRAMASKKRVLERQRPQKFVKPSRGVDIMEVIQDVFHKINFHTHKKKNDNITFTTLLPANAGREEKVHTFIPLLHLENQHKIETEQQKAFGEIKVQLLSSKKGKRSSS